MIGTVVGGAFGLAIGVVLTWPKETRLGSRARELVARARLPHLGPDVIRGLALALPTVAVTRWPVAAITAWMAGRRLEATARRRRTAEERRDRKLAVAAWAETLQGMVLAGHSIEQALGDAADLAPPILRPLLLEAEARREHAGPGIALQGLGSALDDRDADLLIVNLVRATEGRAENLAEVLGILAASIRRAVTMEEEFEAVQAKPRRSIAWASTVFALLALYLVVMAPDLANYYETLVGQLMLAGLVVWFLAGVQVIETLARPIEPEGVLVRRETAERREHLESLVVPVGLVGGAVALLAVVVRASVDFIDWAAGAGTLGAATVVALLSLALMALKDALYPKALPLAVVLTRLDEGPPPGERARSLDGAERAVMRLGEALGLPRRIQRRYAVDLRLVGDTLEQHLSKRFVGFAIGVLALPTLAALAFAVGTPFPFLAPVWVSPILGIAGFLHPGRSLKVRAMARRESLRHALISFLYAAASAMKSRSGREEAVEEAANSGEGWAFAELRAAYWEAWSLQDDVAHHYDRLGRELGSEDLRSIASSLAAGGDSGARIADALIAKAQTMQNSVLSAARTRSAKALEDMDVALVLLVMLPVVAFLAIPAVSQANAI